VRKLDYKDFYDLMVRIGYDADEQEFIGIEALLEWMLKLGFLNEDAINLKNTKDIDKNPSSKEQQPLF